MMTKLKSVHRVFEPRRALTREQRILRDVDLACAQVGVDFEPQVRGELIQGLLVDDPAEDKANSKLLRRTLRDISAGRI